MTEWLLKMLKALALASLALIASLGGAAAYCSTTSAPRCATTNSPFADQSEYDDCQMRMRRYERELSDFLGCLKREAETARSEYDNAIWRFNKNAGN